jgi:hypothetical protein
VNRRRHYKKENSSNDKAIKRVKDCPYGVPQMLKDMGRNYKIEAAIRYALEGLGVNEIALRYLRVTKVFF